MFSCYRELFMNKFEDAAHDPDSYDSGAAASTRNLLRHRHAIENNK